MKQIASKLFSYCKRCVAFLGYWKNQAFFRYFVRTSAFDGANDMFVFRGTYRDIGRQYARLLPVDAYLKRARRYLHAVEGADRKKLYEEIEKAKTTLQACLPSALEMMKGICDIHTAYTLEEAVLLNYATVLTDCKIFSFCSSLAFIEEDSPIIGQNLDLGLRGVYKLAYIVPDDGCAFIAHVNPGFLWFTTGVNQYGVCVSGSSVNTTLTDTGSGRLFPQEMVLFYLLAQAKTSSDAVQLLDNLPQRGPAREGITIIVADKGGAVFNLEISADSVVREESCSGLWITTNHFRHNGLKKLNNIYADGMRTLQKNSEARFQNACCWGKNRKRTVNSLKRLLSDSGASGAWYRNGVYPDNAYTSASYVIDLQKNRIHYRCGRAGGYRELPLEIIYKRLDLSEKGTEN